MDCHILCYMCLTKADEVSLDNVHDVCKVNAVKRMIDRGGGNINCQDCGQNTPLHLVIQHCGDKLRLVTKLLSMGAQPNVYNGNKNTPLHLAIIYNNDERVVQMLIQHGADVHLQDVFNNTPVHLAVRLGKLKMLRLLIKAGAELDSRNLLLETPLMAAVRHSNVTAVKQLLSFGASASVVGLNKYIALHFAARKSHPNLQIICDLMKYDSDANWSDERFQTPIMYALEKYYDIPSDDLASTKLLIKCDVLQRLYNNKKLYLSVFLETYSVFPELYAYFKQCVAEALRMKNQFIQDNFSFFEFAAKGLNNKALFQLTTPYKKAIINQVLRIARAFPFYHDVIACRFEKQDLQRKLMDLIIYSKTDGEEQEIALNSDTNFIIASYLSNLDIFNVIMAFSDYQDFPQHSFGFQNLSLGSSLKETMMRFLKLCFMINFIIIFLFI